MTIGICKMNPNGEGTPVWAYPFVSISSCKVTVVGTPELRDMNGGCAFFLFLGEINLIID